MSVPTVIVALDSGELYPVYSVAEKDGPGLPVPIAADKLAWVERVSREFAAVQEFLDQLDTEARCPKCWRAKHEGECPPRRYGFAASVGDVATSVAATVPVYTRIENPATTLPEGSCWVRDERTGAAMIFPSSTALGL